MKILGKLIQLLIFLFLLPTITYAQSFDWVKDMGGTDYESGYAITVDDAGNIYTIGGFQGTVDFDPNAGTTSLSAVQDNDIFIQKLDTRGNLLWAKGMGGTGDDGGYAIAVDDSGNVYTTGHFQGTIDFDPNAGTFNLTATGSWAIYLQKLDAAGNLVWAKSFDGTAYCVSNAIAVDAQGMIYLTGSFEGSVDFDPNAGTQTMTSIGDADIFMLKIAANGELEWVKTVGSASYDDAIGIAIDGAGNVYSTGSFTETVDFDPGMGTSMLTAATGFFNCYVLKLAANGDFLWAKAAGGMGDVEGVALAIDGAGNACLAGYFSETADFDPGAATFTLTSLSDYAAFILKLDPAGDFLWAKAVGGTGFISPYALALDDDANIYTTGIFSQTIDFDPGAGATNLMTQGILDSYVLKLDAQGELVWVHGIGGTGEVTGNGITLDTWGNVITTGDFSGTVDFDLGTGSNPLTSAGEGDIYVLKLKQDGNVAIESRAPSHISLYPNPSSGLFYLTLPANAHQAEVQVVDHMGRKAAQHTLSPSQNKLDLTHLSAGIYHVCVVLSSGEKFLGKVMLK